MVLPLTGSPSIKIDGELELPVTPVDAHVAVRVAKGLGNLHTLCYVHEGVTIQELRISWMGSTWRLMLKGKRRGRPIVAFFYADQWWDLLAVTVTSVDSGYADWHPDSYPPKQAPPAYDSPPIPLRTTF